MARELRALLLWGRRLRAPALAVTSGGEGGRSGGRGTASSSVVGAGKAPFARRGRLRFTCQTRCERRALGASWSHLAARVFSGADAVELRHV